jgi:hypothetical protein
MKNKNNNDFVYYDDEECHQCGDASGEQALLFFDSCEVTNSRANYFSYRSSILLPGFIQIWNSQIRRLFHDLSLYFPEKNKPISMKPTIFFLNQTIEN